MKILSFYLPQFHEIKENNEWWGKGFTEWTNVKSAKPNFKGHNMPRVPLNDNYYNLLNVDTLKWQANLAKKYGIYGFVYYHYWYEEGMLLEKPAELMLKNKDVDIPFCFCWANHHWNKSWVNKSNTILRKQTYGDKAEWTKHFSYMLNFFKDKRYIKINNKPLLIIYLTSIPCFYEMRKLWEKLAKESGFDGLYILNQENVTNDLTDSTRGGLFDGGIEYQPSRAMSQYKASSISFQISRVTARLGDVIPFIRGKWTTMHYSYDDLWNIILKQKPIDNKSYPGAFVDYDNTPRRKNRSTVVIGSCPEKFKQYLSIQIRRAKNIYHKNYLFLFAWNEWGESGYLEPDKKYGYGNLEAVKEALEENGEFPVWNI